MRHRFLTAITDRGNNDHRSRQQRGEHERLGIETALRMIDQNIEENEVRLREEILRFIKKHEDDVVDRLNKEKSVTIPTSFGEFVLKLGDLRNKILNPIAA